MDKVKWIIFAVLVVAVFGLIIWFNKSDDKQFTGDAGTVITEGPIADHVYGSPDNKVVLIEYGDYQCPACGSMFQPIKQMTEDYKDKLTFVFRHLPLTNIHPNALAAATAAEAAGLQGKYFEMHDLLYISQQSWGSVSADQRGGVFEGYAGQLGLDTGKFKQDLPSKEISDKISRDRSTAKGYNANQTPSIVLEGKLLPTDVATNGASLRKAVEEALKRAYPDFTPIPSSTAE